LIFAVLASGHNIQADGLFFREKMKKFKELYINLSLNIVNWLLVIDIPIM
jgi:hypothetical protein